MIRFLSKADLMTTKYYYVNSVSVSWSGLFESYIYKNKIHNNILMRIVPLYSSSKFTGISRNIRSISEERMVKRK